MSFPADVPLYLRHYFSRPNTGTAEHCLFFLVITGGIFMTGRLEEPSETTGTERWRSISDQRKLGPPAVDYLVSNLRDSDKKVRLAAVDALGEIGDKRAYEHLVGLLEDPDHDVRFACVVALGAIGDERARGPLDEACRDRNGFVRAVAQEMLEKLKAGQSS